LNSSPLKGDELWRKAFSGETSPVCRQRRALSMRQIEVVKNVFAAPVVLDSGEE
jgi:hypothetical protein